MFDNKIKKELPPEIETRLEKFDKQNFFLVYGENEGLKNEVIQIIKKNLNGVVENFDEVLESIVVGQEWDDDIRVVLFIKLGSFNYVIYN